MPKHATTRIIQYNPLQHQAVKAWCELCPECVIPKQIQVLKEQRNRSAVYRLEGIGPAGSAVIAKRCRQASAIKELAIYEHVLPQLPVPTLQLYGFVVELQSEYCWLFLEDAGDEIYSSHSENQRALAARWLGLLHTSPVGSSVKAYLPDRTPSQYLDGLRSTRDVILQSLGNPAVCADDLELLKQLVSQCDLVEAHWSYIQRFCDGIPPTLVHCDFERKNIRVRTSPTGTFLFPFDWELAGWGVPATDLANIDISTYWSVVQDRWSNLDLHTIERLAQVGKLFRYFAAIPWEASSLTSPWVAITMETLRFYQAEIAGVIDAVGWDGPA